ncbi:TPA: hypothetical protein DDZ75_00830 [Patescibacteria group bacterium]|nr:hypothetical protein [Patescibacteria group bacterium]
MLLMRGDYSLAVERFGEKQVRDEIDHMINNSLASIAILAADYLGYNDLAEKAAKVVSLSGCYDDKAKELAKKYHQ